MKHEIKKGFFIEKDSGWIISLNNLNDSEFQDAFKIQKKNLKHSTKSSFNAFKRIKKYIIKNYPELLI